MRGKDHHLSVRQGFTQSLPGQTIENCASFSPILLSLQSKANAPDEQRRATDARHQADYDNAKTWTPREAREKITVAQSAFENWDKIRTDPASNEYLL